MGQPTGAHDPSAPSGHLPTLSRREENEGRMLKQKSLCFPPCAQRGEVAR